MTFFAFPGWGVFDFTGVYEKQAVLLGAHGYATKAEAQAHVNASVSPDQAAFLQAAKVAGKSPIGAGAVGVQSAPGDSGPSNPFTSITQFFHILTDKNVWIRIGEFTLGALLMTVGLAHLLGADSAIGKVAQKLPLGMVIP